MSRNMNKTLLILILAAASGCAYQEPVPYKIFGIQKFLEIKRNPKPFVGKLYAFGGRVTSTDVKSNMTTFRILVQEYDPGTSSYITGNSSLLVIYPAGGTTVADGHHVKVLGYIREPAVGKTILGDKVSSLAMDAVAIYDSFTRFPFCLSDQQDLFNKWKTGEPLPP